MTSDDSQLENSQLNDLFRGYRSSCPDIEPRSDFMPRLWQKIESRYGFWFVFQGLARTAMTGCAALCLVLLVLNFSSSSQAHRATATYTDALVAEHSAEKTYYTEALSPVSFHEDFPAAPRR